jgi:modification target Cys-rich repeat protein
MAETCDEGTYCYWSCGGTCDGTCIGDTCEDTCNSCIPGGVTCSMVYTCMPSTNYYACHAQNIDVEGFN